MSQLIQSPVGTPSPALPSPRRATLRSTSYRPVRRAAESPAQCPASDRPSPPASAVIPDRRHAPPACTSCPCISVAYLLFPRTVNPSAELLLSASGACVTVYEERAGGQPPKR